MFIDIHHPDAWDAFIYLNGFRVECVAADDKAGWVEVYSNTAKEMLSLPNDPTHRIYGSVRIVIVKSERERILVKSSREYQHHLRPRASI